MNFESQFLPLVLIVVVAFFVPLVAARFKGIKIPPIVLEIIFGIILGKSGLNLVKPVPVVEFLSDFGFIFLMFLSGFEIDLSFFAGSRRGFRLVLVPTTIFFATAGLCYLFGFLLVRMGMVSDNFLFSLLLATTSVGIVLPTLKERNEVRSKFGQIVIMIALFADMATMIFLTVYIILHSHGWGREVIFMGGLLLLFFLMIIGGRALAKKAGIIRLLDELAHASTQIKVRGAIALLVVFATVSEVFGVETILGAFIAGLIVSMIMREGKELLSMKLDGIGYGFFIPIFFIMVGARLDLPHLLESRSFLFLVPYILFVAYVVKVLPSFILKMDFSYRDCVGAGVLISSRLSLIIAASEIALAMGLIDSALNTAIVLVAMFTSVFSPVIYSKVRVREKYGRSKIVIAGAGRVGRELYERVLLHNPSAIMIEKDKNQLNKLKSSSLRNVIIGDCTDHDVLEKAMLGPVDVFIAVTGDDSVNFRACLLAKNQFGVGRVIARDNNPGNADEFRKKGVIPINLATQVAIATENLILRPTFVNFLEREKDGFLSFEVVVKNPNYFGVKLRDFTEIRDGLVLLVRRKDEIIIPHGDTVIREGDSLVICGLPEDEFRIRSCLESGFCDLPDDVVEG